MTRSVIVSAITLIFAASSGDGLVKLYDSLAFEGLFYQSTANENCTVIPSYGWDVASSLTTDQCIMVYTADACGGSSIKIPPGDHSDLRDFQRPELNFDNKIKSYRTCTQGEALTVSLITGNGEAAATIVTFNDVCGCMNLPLYAHGKINGVNNRGNCVKLYSEVECRGSNVEIAGGSGAETSNLTVAGFNGATKSISGCGTTASCSRLTASIFKFDLVTDSFRVQNSTEELIPMSSNITFVNNGGATVKELYEAVKDVNEIISVTRDSTLRTLYRSSVSSNVEVVNGVGIPLFGKNEMSSILSSAYTFSNGPGVVASDKFVRNETREFRATQDIDISACSSYTVTSYLRFVYNYPVNFELYATIGGASGDRKLTAAEVKDRLGTLEYVEDQDEHNVVTKANGTIMADFALEAVLDGDGTKIHTCTMQEHNKVNLKPVSLYSVSE